MQIHRLLVLLTLAIYLIIPMGVDWWLQSYAPWHGIFIGWLALVIFLYFLDRRREQNV